MAELLAADGETVLADSSALLDKAAADRDFSEAMVTQPSGDLPLRQEPAEDEAPKRKRGRPPKSDQARVMTGPAPGGKRLTRESRVEGVKGLAQVAAVIPLMLGRSTGNLAYTADAIVIADNADVLAEACAGVAEQDARFGAVLDKVCSAGPYGALITAAMGVVSQLVRNHRPGLSIPGTVHPDELLAAAMPAAA